MNRTQHLIFLFILLVSQNMKAQLIPGVEENIPFLVTFGKDAKLEYGDDDFSQTFFFRIPKEYNKPFFIRIFDPEIGGKNDELIGGANTKTTFNLYGGPEAFSNADAKGQHPKGNYKSGNLIYSKSFTVSSEYDNKWYTMGPLNPSEGEYIAEFDSYMFKLIAEGVSGNDGNLYQYFLTSSHNSNVPIVNGNAFTYEYSVRLHDEPGTVSHIYPYIDQNVISIKQNNFDWDNDGLIVIYSIKKLAEKANTSQQANWAQSKHIIEEEEKGSCLDFQLIKSKKEGYSNNNVVFFITNQYGESMPFFSVPIGVYSPTNKKIKVE